MNSYFYKFTLILLIFISGCAVICPTCPQNEQDKHGHGFSIKDTFLEDIAYCAHGNNFEIINMEAGRLFLDGKGERESLCIRYKETTGIKKIGASGSVRGTGGSFEYENKGTEIDRFCIERKLKNNKYFFKVYEGIGFKKFYDTHCKNFTRWGFFDDSGIFTND
ncbi:hypothetical protein [Desulfonema magnum]|uniref:Lipoprotein n=1 Tax=Desulfonema magnum TaxID=45655 RepID=A0A975BT03_9BACT|nr:hypothetical protein [Desulfonema magnum]QTA91249.1 Uncharacterized protein dnm_073130 [Desulfonema magnum]